MKNIKEKIFEITNYQFETFDNAIECAFENLGERLENLNKNNNSREYSYLSDKLKKGILNFDEYLDQLMKLLRETLCSIGTSFSIEQELKTLSEMRIIYLYKNIEISIKRIIEIAYPEIKTNSFFNWNSMNNFFKSKHIELKNVAKYDIYDQLRLVNNNIKHSEIINKEIKKIKEFKNNEKFDFSTLSEFYMRIYQGIHLFLNEVGNQIINELYLFSDERLTELSNSYKDRMSIKDLNLFIEKLKKPTANNI